MNLKISGLKKKIYLTNMNYNNYLCMICMQYYSKYITHIDTILNYYVSLIIIYII